MSAPTSASLFVLLLGLLTCSQAEDFTVAARLGANVILPCHAERNINTAVWRLKGEDDGFVLYRNGDPNAKKKLLPSFKGRVELKEGWKEDGDASLTLKNVSTEDSGTYECRVKGDTIKGAPLISRVNLTVLSNECTQGKGSRRKRAADSNCTGHSGGDKERSRGGHVGLVVGVTLFVIVAAVAVVGFMIYRRRQMKSSPPPPPDEAVKVQLV
ncbi:butyrophilin-like protein 2 [Parambassis ranga]|uniref:Butyrophilin-like protein 2 n=1 Tax=Parambassis ranga TaxID=210632 RepID=A0A6P7IIF1_9TELE|nr:butyrophilin-like protein 2 [Parambassis ranga]